MTETKINFDNLGVEPAIVEDDTQPSEVQHQLEVARDLAQEYDAMLVSIKLEPSDGVLKIFQAVLRRNFVGFQTHGVSDSFSGTADIDATTRRFKTVAKDSNVLTPDQRQAITNWLIQKIIENPQHGNILYNLFLNRV